MSTLASNPESNNIRSRDLQATAAITLRPWFADHRATVRRALGWFGITEQEDRADLTQDIFFSAYLALRRGERIENPSAWLRECARRYARSFRREARRRRPLIGGHWLDDGKDPEMLTSDRERLHRALANLSEEALAILFDIRVEGVLWAEVAEERRITIDQARYIHQRAVSQIKKVSHDSGRGFKNIGATKSAGASGVGAK
jgi:DNA-directed RNA polymerase specialized sigma24 family protein